MVRIRSLSLCDLFLLSLYRKATCYARIKPLF